MKIIPGAFYIYKLRNPCAAIGYPDLGKILFKIVKTGHTDYIWQVHLKSQDLIIRVFVRNKAVNSKFPYLNGFNYTSVMTLEHEPVILLPDGFETHQQTFSTIAN